MSKVTPETIKEMRTLRDSTGLSYNKIGIRFRVSETTVMYHLTPEARRRAIDRSAIYSKAHPEYKNSNEYMRTYMEEYNRDPEHRAAAGRRTKKYQAKNRARLNRYSFERSFRCRTCKKDFFDREAHIMEDRTIGVCPRCGKTNVKSLLLFSYWIEKEKQVLFEFLRENGPVQMFEIRKAMGWNRNLCYERVGSLMEEKKVTRVGWGRYLV